MMVGRTVSFRIDKKPCHPGELVLKIDNLTVIGSKGVPSVRGLSLDVALVKWWVWRGSMETGNPN